MRSFSTILMAAALATATLAQKPASEPVPIRREESAVPTPAERSVAWARQAIASDPTRSGGYTALAMALARRARETHDTDFYSEAQTAVDRSFELEAGNYAARRVQIWLQLGRHEFARALVAAKQLHSESPDDIMVSGMLVDASVELGYYDDAERVAQRMLDMRPGSIPALTRAAYLRELFGDLEGAVMLFEDALQNLPAQETEDQAWLLTQIGRLLREGGRPERAQPRIEAALVLFPEYHYALVELARTKLALRDWDGAVGLFRRHVAVAPHPENFYGLGRALAEAGLAAEAKQAFERFVAGARAESDATDNANRQLITYYCAEGGEPEAALELAEREIAARGDVETREAYAAALVGVGRADDAKREIDQVLAIGVRRASTCYLAARIELARGDTPAARALLERSLAVNPSSPIADEAKDLLGSL